MTVVLIIFAFINVLSHFSFLHRRKLRITVSYFILLEFLWGTLCPKRRKK
jgi:hypothetical protein